MYGHAGFMTGPRAPVQWPQSRIRISGRRKSVTLYFLRQLILAREIVEPCHCCIELQIDCPGRTVALLADNDFRLAVYGRHFYLPLAMLVGPRPRLLVAEIIFLAKHEQYHV